MWFHVNYDVICTDDLHVVISRPSQLSRQDQERRDWRKQLDEAFSDVTLFTPNGCGKIGIFYSFIQLYI